MGAAARSVARTTIAPARPRLRIVPGGRRRTRSAARAANAFHVVLCCLIVIACAGLFRVNLAARAAEAAIDASSLRAEVKTERQLGRTLQADKSALAAPSRIENLACQTMNMNAPAEVCYLQLPETASDGSAPSSASDRVAQDGPGVLDTLMDLAAGEAQVLLVGDMGLGSVR